MSKNLFSGPVIQGNLVGKDALLKINEFKEMAKLMGMTGCKYMYIEEGTMEYTIHGEITAKYSEPVDIPLIWMEVPDQETATTYGWVSVLPDDKPYLAQIPYDTPNLREGCRISIPFVGDSRVDGEDGDSKVFRITRVYTISRFPNCRMVQLAPEVESRLIVDKMDLPKNKDKNYNYLKVDQNS